MSLGNTIPVYKRLAATAVIDGTTIDITQFELDYFYNQVPKASIVFAMGKDKDGNVAESHHLIDKIKRQSSLEIWLYVKKEDSIIWERSLVFQGTVTGVNYNRSFTTCSAVVGGVGKLNKLQYSTSFCKMFAVGSVADIFMPVAHNIGGSNIATVAQMLAQLKVVELPNDFWSSGVKDLLVRLCGTNVLKGNLPGIGASLLKEGLKGTYNNSYALEALTEMDRSTPFKLQGDIIANYPMIYAICSYLVNIVNLQGGAPDTVMAKLLSSIIPFGAILVPMVNTFVVAPHLPAIKSTNGTFVEIGADQYEYFSTSGYRRPLSGVKFFLSARSKTNIGLKKGHIYLLDKAFGYENGAQGQILIVPAPVWCGADLGSLLEFDETGSNKYSGINPEPASDGETPNTEKVEAYKVASSTMKRLGHYIYCNEVFQANLSQLKGKLRVDITPGANVKIEIPGEEIYGEKYIYANVHGVKISVNNNSNPPDASTTLFLTHTRSKADDGLMLDEHPMFDTYFNGKNWKISESKQLEMD